MKKNLLAFFMVLAACVAMNTKSSAQSTLIHYWNFNSTSSASIFTPTITALPADYSDLPTSNARILYAEQPGTSAAYSTSLDDGFSSTGTLDDTVNLRMGATSGNYIRTRNPSDSMELLFYTPSTHFKNLVLTFGTSRPVNGQIHQKYDYSIDSGATWMTTGLSLLSDSVWSYFQRITLTSTNAAVNNNSKLVFRIRWAGDSTGTMGNNRFDNVSLDGDTIGVSSEAVNNIPAISAPYTLYPNPVINNLDISTSAEGARHVIITNTIGQKVYEGDEEKKQFSVSTAGMRAGCYFIRISENTTGGVSTMQFIKQ